MINYINDMLNPIWALKISKVDYDLFGGSITIYLFDELKNPMIITFIGVTSFLWLRNSKGAFVDFDESMYLELTSISVGSANVNLMQDKWLKYYSIKPNILIEIVDSAMVIQAKEIILNGQKLSLPM